MTKWLYISVTALTCSVGFLGCGEDFPPASAVDYLRVLAIAADPPEVTDPGFSEVSALVVGAEGELSYRWEFCPVPGPDILGLVCLVPDLSCVLSEEETATVFIPPLDDFLLSPDFSELYVDLEEGIEVQVRLTVTDTSGSCDGGETCPEGYACVAAAELVTDKISCEELFGLSSDPVAACLDKSCGAELNGCIANEDCLVIFDCVDFCEDGDDVCQAGCVGNAPAIAGELFLAFVECGAANGCFELSEEPVDTPDGSDAPTGAVCVRQEEAVKGVRVSRNEAQNTNPSISVLQLEADPNAEPVPLIEGETKEIHVVAPDHPMNQDYFYLFSGSQLPFSAVIAEETRESVDEEGGVQNENLLISWFTDVGGLQSERTGEFGAEPRGDLTGVGSNEDCGESGAALCAFPNEWRPPALEAGESREGSIWAVIRDGRGGVDWLSRRVRIEAEEP